MRILSAKSLNAEASMVFLEVRHPQYGDVPFTWCANPEDEGEDTYGIKEDVREALARGGVVVTPYVAPPPQPATKEQLAAEARAYLASTDWYVVRRSETGEPIPQDVMDKRAAARAAANV